MLLMSVLIVCCTKEDRKVQIATQIKDIDAYAKAAVKSGKNVVLNNGSTRVIITEGVGESLMVGDSVFFDFAGYIFKSGLGKLFETNVPSIANAAGINIYNRDFDYGRGLVGKGLFVSGLDHGLLGAKNGEHSYIVFPASQGFGNNDVGLVPKLSPLIFEVWIKEIKKN